MSVELGVPVSALRASDSSRADASRQSTILCHKHSINMFTNLAKGVRTADA